jgi:hypothetical protein
MKKTLTILGFLAVIPAGAAFADDDCFSPMAQWQSRDAAMAHAVELGIEVQRLKVDDGCYEIRGRDADDNRVELKLEPSTLGLVEFEVKFRRGADPSRYLPGAHGVDAAPRQAPAGNPLITPGTTPTENRN